MTDRIKEQVNATVNQQHADMVSKLCKPGDDILQSLTGFKADLWHVASCVPSEAGELFDAVKKFVIYGKSDLDIENVIEELGDIEFYLQRIRELLEIDREETLRANIQKLSKRYENFNYSDQAAQERADKSETGKNIPWSDFLKITKLSENLTIEDFKKRAKTCTKAQCSGCDKATFYGNSDLGIKLCAYCPKCDHYFIYPNEFEEVDKQNNGD